MDEKVSSSGASSSKTKLIKLSYGGNTFQVNLDQEEADRLLSSSEYALEYAKQLLSEKSQQIEELVVPMSEECVPNSMQIENEVMTAVESVENQLSEDSVTQIEVQFNSEYDSKEAFDIVNSSDEFKWTHQTTISLIENRAACNTEFLSPSVRKNQLWARIAKTLNISLNLNPSVNGIQCDSKWRNLLSRYRAINNKMKKLGKKVVVRWDYYQLMDRIEKDRENLINSSSTDNNTDESAAAILQAMSNSPMLPESDESNCTLESLDSDSEEQINLDTNSLSLKTNYSSLVDILKKQRDTRKRKREDNEDCQAPKWFLKYIRERKEADAKRQEDENKRWSELQKLEKRKIRAFESLTAVLLETLTKKK